MQTILPNNVTDEELARDWTLSPEDLAEVRRCRGDAKRHSFALQLCMLRRYGTFLGDDYRGVPTKIVNHVGKQLEIPPVLVIAPPAREATDLEHERKIREYLGFCPFGEVEAFELEAVLRRSAANGALSDDLLVESKKHLLARKIIIPAGYRLERIVGSITSRADEEAFERVRVRLEPAMCEAIDGLLNTKGEHRSALFHLKQYPPDPKPETINLYFERAELLRGFGAGRVDFAGIRSDVIEHFAELTRRYDVKELRRFAPVKRYALVACFLAEATKSVLDHLVEMHHVYMTKVHRRATRAFDKRYRQLRNRSTRNLRVVLDALEMLLDPKRDVGDASSDLDLDQVREAMMVCREMQRINDRGVLDELRVRHHLVKRYLPQFLRLPFRASPGSESLLAAIELARAVHRGDRADLGTDAPVNFLRGASRGIWRSALASSDGVPIDARVWELALADSVREALRAGDLYLDQSRHHRSFVNLLHTSEQWTEERSHAYAGLNLPTEVDIAIGHLREELDEQAQVFTNGLATNKFATIHDGKLALSKRDPAEPSKRASELRDVIGTHLPAIRIEDLLVDVNTWTGFTREFVPVGNYAPRIDNLYPTLLAGIVAQGTNLGVVAMANATKEVTLDGLQHVTRWFLGQDTLKAANRVLVDYHHGLPLAFTWGGGDTSSSDGQRFGVRESSLLAGFYPRHFGYYDRAFSLYTHMSNQWSVFAARAISCSPREAIYVLDGLLENDTVLRSREHYTDTHGAIEQLFGLCYLLGISFMPRLRDPADQQLWKLDRERFYGTIDPLFTGAVDVALICEQWDSMVRVAASLRNRSAPAHVVVDRLTATSQTDRLAKAFRMLGRIVKTTYLLHFFHDAELRGRVHLQLNRGESRHALARCLFFGNEGVFRTGDLEEIMNKVSALSVLSNAVLVWNTVHMAKIVAQLEARGEVVAKEDLARVSPLAHEHVTAFGTYHFDRATNTRQRAEAALP